MIAFHCSPLDEESRASGISQGCRRDWGFQSNRIGSQRLILAGRLGEPSAVPPREPSDRVRWAA